MKYDRHAAILDIIEQDAIETQEELAARLRLRGFDVTQATVSRDIKELHLVKIAESEGRLRYTAFDAGAPSLPDRLLPVFAHAFASADNANNLVVVKTLSGMAQALASAVDSMELAGTLGSVAGDDAVLIVCRTEKHAERMVSLFRRIAGGG